MFNHKLFSLLTTTALMLGFSTPIWVGSIEPSQAQRFENMPQGEVLKKLNLSDTQMQQLKAIRDRNKDTLKSSTQQLRQASQDIQNLLAGTASTEQIRSKFNQVQNLKQQVAKLQFEQMLAMREILTPQQRTQLAQTMAQFKGNMRQRLQDRRQNRP